MNVEFPKIGNGAMSYSSKSLHESLAKEQILSKFISFAFEDKISNPNYHYKLENDNYMLNGYNCYKIQCFSKEKLLKTICISKKLNIIIQITQYFDDNYSLNYKFNYNSDNIVLPNDVIDLMKNR